MNHLVEAPFPTQPQDSAKRWRKWATRAAAGVAGLVLSTVLMGTAFFKPRIVDGALSLTPRFTIGAWIHDLPSHLPWVAAFALLTASIIPLRALQWRFTLGERAPAFGQRYHAVAIGAFFHNAIPGKLGEFVRAFILARRHKLPFFECLGSVLLCKLLELGALVTLVAIALAGPLGGATPTLSTALFIAVGLCVALAAVAILGARHAVPLAKHLERRNKLPRLRMALLHMGNGLHATRSPRRLGLGLLASLGPVLAPAIAYGVALQALGVKNGLFAGGIVLGAISLGQLTPGLPVGMGMYYLTTSWAARSLGATPAQAAAFAALTHVATFTTQLLVGAISLAIHRIKPRELLREREAAMSLESMAAIPEPQPVPVPVMIEPHLKVSGIS